MEALQIPTPSEEDSDNVVTALETAAIFGAKGDASEAVRWLKRAAESAGADGRDDRALSLARMAADLAENSAHEPTDAPPSAEGRERRLPKPPPRPMSSVRPPPPSSRHKESEAAPIPLSRPSATPMPTSVKPKVETGRPPQVAASGSVRPSYSPSPPKVVTSVRPAPPSVAPEPRVGKSSFGPAKPSQKPAKPDTSARSSQTPAPASVQAAVEKPSSLNGASKSVAPKPAVVPSTENGRRSEAKAKPAVVETKPAPAEETKAPPPVAEHPEETTAAPPAVALKSEALAEKHEAVTAKSEALAEKHEAVTAKSEAPAERHEAPATSSEPPRALGRRQAARVSIEPSSGSKRFYVLRVLDEGEAVPEKGIEAFIVLTDPNARFPEG